MNRAKARAHSWDGQARPHQRDICTKFILPTVKRAGWDEMVHVREEVYFTKGGIIERASFSRLVVRSTLSSYTACKPTASPDTVPLSALRMLLLPLPPLAEQHRIIAKVDALMALCDRLEESLTASAAARRRLLDALLAEALRRPTITNWRQRNKMAINLVIAVTDGDWFDMLRQQPNLAGKFLGAVRRQFRALQPGELFLFKLHAPRNVIVGGGIFAYANALPCSLAWEAFREANGARSAQEMRARIARYRRADPADRSDFEIGCRILTQPFFFPEADWIPVPVSWAPNIVSFKTYNTGEADGLALWDAVNDRLNRPSFPALPKHRRGSASRSSSVRALGKARSGFL